MPATLTTAPRRLVSQHEAAAYLGVTDRTIRNYISRGELRAYRLAGRLVRLDQSELDAMLRPIPTAGRGRHV
ncbi:DNA binding domain-containing protein [metagenome]|uniref:DNA binding domain-containing protein n=1 Tax=metagenome TaxID=256318 RepID=A0A2P2BY66_9ZZZZ